MTIPNPIRSMTTTRKITVSDVVRWDGFTIIGSIHPSENNGSNMKNGAVLVK
jgi:hypothetical protein